jgi:hypothetical protein
MVLWEARRMPMAARESELNFMCTTESKEALAFGIDQHVRLDSKTF